MRIEEMTLPEYAEDMWNFVHLPEVWPYFEKTKERYNLSICQYVVYFAPVEFEKYLKDKKRI